MFISSIHPVPQKKKKYCNVSHIHGTQIKFRIRDKYTSLVKDTLAFGSVDTLIIGLGKNIHTLRFKHEYTARLKFVGMQVCWQQWSPTSLKIKQQVLSPEILVIFRQITRLNVKCILHGHQLITMRNSNFTLG